MIHFRSEDSFVVRFLVSRTYREWNVCRRSRKAYKSKNVCSETWFWSRSYNDAIFRCCIRSLYCLFLGDIWTLFGDRSTRGGVMYWFQWVEFYWNRIVTDPLLMVFWYVIIKRYPMVVPYARLFSLTWLWVHIFVFPHSMYLQDIIF